MVRVESVRIVTDDREVLVQSVPAVDVARRHVPARTVTPRPPPGGRVHSRVASVAGCGNAPSGARARDDHREAL